MKTVARVDEMQSLAMSLRKNGERIGLVPTMGFLHEGHLSLMRVARSAATVRVVSVFVNPTQFGPGEDFDRYPRAIERDRAMCAAEGIDVFFCPEQDALYAPEHSVWVEETALSIGLCGACRPGHFRGVTTIVAKLFNIVQPHIAVFGQKDLQQARVIERMVKDLNFPLEVRVARTVREPDGLAMSSRNAYLSAEERREAVRIREALGIAESLLGGGQRDAATLKSAMRAHIESSPILRVQYLEIVDYESLLPIARVAAKAAAAVAVTAGRTRLIDNVILDV